MLDINTQIKKLNELETKTTFMTNSNALMNKIIKITDLEMPVYHTSLSNKLQRVDIVRRDIIKKQTPKQYQNDLRISPAFNPCTEFYTRVTKPVSKNGQTNVMTIFYPLDLKVVKAMISELTVVLTNAQTHVVHVN